MAIEPLLQYAGIDKAFGNARLCAEASLEVAPGESWA